MTKQIRKGVLFTLGVLVAALGGFAYVAGSVYVAGTRMRAVGASVFQCAQRDGRMPASLEEMVQAGCIRPTDGDDHGKYLVIDRVTGQPVGSAVDMDRYDISWGVQPDQLVERDKILYWRDRPDERALLIRDRRPPLMVRAMGGRLAMAFPRELYRELAAWQAATTQSQPAGHP